VSVCSLLIDIDGDLELEYTVSIHARISGVSWSCMVRSRSLHKIIQVKIRFASESDARGYILLFDLQMQPRSCMH
jgi:hypothetical protein